MKTLLRLVVTVLLLLGWGLAAASLHVVRTPDKITLVPKNRLGVEDTFVDTRAWTLDEAATHPGLLLRLLESGKADALAHLVEPEDREEIHEHLVDALRRAPREETPQRELLPTTGPLEHQSAATGAGLLETAEGVVKFLRSIDY